MHVFPCFFCPFLFSWPAWHFDFDFSAISRAVPWVSPFSACVLAVLFNKKPLLSWNTQNSLFKWSLPSRSHLVDRLSFEILTCALYQLFSQHHELLGLLECFPSQPEPFNSKNNVSPRPCRWLMHSGNAMVTGRVDVHGWVKEAPQRRERLSFLFFLLPSDGFLPLTSVSKPILFV